MGRANGGERFGALGAKVDLLGTLIAEQRAETRGWRDAVRSELVVLRAEVIARMDKHEVEDNAHHDESVRRTERLEGQTLDGAKMVLARVEALERDLAGRPVLSDRVIALERTREAGQAVDAYKKWLVGTLVLAAISIFMNAFARLEPLIRAWAGR